MYFCQKGKELLLVNSFKFRAMNKLRNGRIRWGCVENSCPAKLYTLSDKTVFAESDVSHNHRIDGQL